MQIGASMSDSIVEKVMRSASALLNSGYSVVHQHTYEDTAGTFTLAKSDVRVRIAGHLDWVVEIGSDADPSEWYDSALVLCEIGVKQRPRAAHNEPTLTKLCELLAQHGPRWEALFLRATYPMARRSLRAHRTTEAEKTWR